MALKNSVLLLLTIAFLLANTASSARDFPIATKPSLDLARILQGSNSNTTDDCWTALSELRSCSNEVVSFFLNGYADIDTPCCQAIEVITRHCWPSMLSVLGITAEEGNLLAGYCEKASGLSSGPSSSPAGAPPISA